MTPEVSQTGQGDGTPSADEALFTTTSDNLPPLRVHERVDSLLMQVECFAFVIRKPLHEVKMYAAIERATQDALHVRVVFDFRNPPSVALLSGHFDKLLVLLIFLGSDGSRLADEIEFGQLQFHPLLVRDRIRMLTDEVFLHSLQFEASICFLLCLCLCLF
jgi:hypothetical protein